MVLAAWGETESRSMNASGVYRLLFPQSTEEQAASSPAKAIGPGGGGRVLVAAPAADMYSLLFTKALPGSVSTALSAAQTQLAGSSAAAPKKGAETPPSLMKVLQQQPPSLLSSSSVHGGSFSGVRRVKEAKRQVDQLNAASARQSSAARSPPRTPPKASGPEDFLTRMARSKQQAVTAEVEAAAAAEARERAREEAAARQKIGRAHV